MDIIIHTDGSCQPNPGPGGWASIIQIGQELKEISGFEKNATNNRMEIMAVLKGLQQIATPSEVVIYSDSQYVVNSIGSWKDGKPFGKKGWMVKWKSLGWVRSEGELKNADLWEQMDVLVKFHLNVRLSWVRGHDGNQLNERCDELALKERLKA